MVLDLCQFLAFSSVFTLFLSLSMVSAFLGQLEDIVLYTTDNIPVFQEYVIFQWQSHSAPKPERLVTFVIVFRTAIFMALTHYIVV